MIRRYWVSSMSIWGLCKCENGGNLTMLAIAFYNGLKSVVTKPHRGYASGDCASEYFMLLVEVQSRMLGVILARNFDPC